jgi:hypothetical protein
MNGRPSPVLFGMTSVFSMSCALDAAILVLVSLSLRPSTFGRRQLTGHFRMGKLVHG